MTDQPAHRCPAAEPGPSPTGSAGARALPGIPMRMRFQREHHGLAVPYATKWHAGQPLWGKFDAELFREVMTRGLCQMCGQRLSARAVLVLRPNDYLRRVAVEPPMHPECERYARHACPMLTGRMARYSANPDHLRRPCTDPDCECARWAPPDPDAELRLGRDADSWYAVTVRTSDLRVITDTESRSLAVDLTGLTLGKVEPIRRVPDAPPNLLDLLPLRALLGF